MPEDGKERADEIDLTRPGVLHIFHQPAPGEHDRDHADLEQERDAV